MPLAMRARIQASIAAVVLLFVFVFGQALPAQTDVADITPTIDRQQLDQVVLESFKKSHDGFSSDEVILNDELNAAFLKLCRESLPNVGPEVFNWRLMNLRKAGKLKTKSTKRSSSKHSHLTHIAELAARSTIDRYQVSIDQVMATPEMKSGFDKVANSVVPGVDLYLVRKAAFQLRKTRRLRPELITRIADWGREIKSFSAESIASNPNCIPAHPGIYIFSDKTGYLYIGQTDDLHERLKTHLDQSHNLSLAKYLKVENLSGITIEIHAFKPDSRAKETMIRRAYESELIASRKPRFNIQP
jgi:predicted GIY-YIG superfamily endonuclease